MLNALIIQLAVMFLPVAVLALAVEMFLGLRKAKKLRKPSADKMLRAAGESLRRKLEELDERIYTWISALVASATVAGVFANQAYSQTKSVQATFMHPGVLILLFGGFYCVWKLLVLLEQRRNDRLGLSGELAVGEELNQLMAAGCRVFHDFPGGDDWNIDHIIVARSGVFAIETKTRSKRPAVKGQPNYEVKYNGEILSFPDGWTAKPLEQADRNAVQLRVFIHKAAGEDVPVIPVVVLPGWYVTGKREAPVKVLNPKMIRGLVLNGRPVLTEDQMQRICFQIDRECRDVEF